MRGRNLFFIVLTFLVGHNSFAKWQFHRKFGRTTIYKDSEISARLISNYSTTTVGYRRANFSKSNLAKLHDGRKQALEFTGVKSWKLDKSQVIEEKSVSKIVLTGSYIDSLKNKIYFKEFHYYSPSSKLQILTTVESKDNLSKISEDGLIRIKSKYGF